MLPHTWRDQILKEFTPQIARLTLVADPDGLLTEEGVLAGLRERGFELIPFEDHVAFRYAYESKYRSRWDRGELTDLVVVLRAPSQELRLLPYDLLQAGRKLSFNLGDLFPNLSYPVVASLDRGDLDALYRAREQYAPGNLGDNATKDFVLRHVFGFAPEFIKEPQDLLRALLRRHYRGQRVPRILDERVIRILRETERFAKWPLEQVVPDRQAFFGFLQERWPIFLDRAAAGGTEIAGEGKPPYGLRFPGPADLPFEHDDIRVYIDTMFVEGHLSPVCHPRTDTLSRQWVAVGLRIEPQADRSRRIEGLLATLEESIPGEYARHNDWFNFARAWAELLALRHDGYVTRSPEEAEELQDLREKVDVAFLSWVNARYSGLHNHPASPPAMLHHVPREIARSLEETRHRKAALVLLDGLALDQWVVVRNVLTAQRPEWRFREGAVFAWIPTLTSVSRQAAFSGKPPIYFPGCIHNTSKEPALWTQFWVDRGLQKVEMAYRSGLGAGDLCEVGEIISHPKVRVVGLVVDKVDKIMHGMQLGTAGMHNQVRQWAEEGYLAGLLDLLLARGFDVCLTSDHGSIEAPGCGHPAEGAAAELRGERARVYPDAVLRKNVQERFPGSIAWEPIGLPDDYLALLAPGRWAFVREDERIVAHGGISLEEVVVPLVFIDRRGA
ncbi:MAG: BREX-3 system phosphatase PglZ [Bacillota bacterium]